MATYPTPPVNGNRKRKPKGLQFAQPKMTKKPSASRPRTLQEKQAAGLAVKGIRPKGPRKPTKAGDDMLKPYYAIKPARRTPSGPNKIVKAPLMKGATPRAIKPVMTRKKSRKSY